MIMISLDSYMIVLQHYVINDLVNVSKLHYSAYCM